MNECAIVPKVGMPKSFSASMVAVPANPATVARSRGHQPGFGAMRPAQAEIDQKLPGAASIIRAALDAIND